MAAPNPIGQAYTELDSLSRTRYGIPASVLLAKLEKGESGGSGTAVSGAGAKKWFQFMPGTRQAVVKQYGIDPWRSEQEARDAAVLHLTGKLGNAKGLEGYNPGGGQQYVQYILDQKVGKNGISAKVGNALAPTAAPATASTSGVDNKSLALSLLGFGSGGNDPSDPLTMALQSAQQSMEQTPQAQAAPTATTGAKSTGGLVPQVVKALAFARAHGWKGQVNSGYRSDAEQLRIWNSGVRPAAKPKALGGSGSNHSSGTAVDVSDVAGFARAMAQAPPAIRLYNRVPNDQLHFSVTGR